MRRWAKLRLGAAATRDGKIEPRKQTKFRALALAGQDEQLRRLELANEHYSVVIEQESNGTFSAWVAGLPGVYAAADTKQEAKRAIRGASVAHLEALSNLNRPVRPNAEIMVLRCVGQKTMETVGIGALLGRHRSRAKATAARENGRKGGRPRSVSAHR